MLAADQLKRSIELAHAKVNLRSKWPGVSVVAVQSSGNGHYKVGDAMNVDAMLDLPGIDPSLVQVQMFCGLVNASGEIDQPQVLAMQHVRAISSDRHMFTGTIRCQASGRQGYAIRVVPGLPDQATPFEPGLIAWN
jgi:starch phosphorylase